MFKYLPHTESEIKEMLEVIGIDNIDELFNEVPQELLGHDFDIPNSKSELEINKFFKNLAGKNKELISFMGAGAYDHYTPSIIKHLISRQEFLTAYTPYQPEISQGTLQYIFEFQSMISTLTGMDVANASMYDGATSTAEAMFMACNAKKRKKILISRTLNPNIIKVIETYAHYKYIEVEYIEEVDGVTSLADLKSKLTKDIAGVIVQTPNFYGNIEDYTGFSDAIAEVKGVFIINQDPSTLSVLKTPREWGADVAVGDCQTFGIPLAYGGPYVGYFATTTKLMRKMPGRICGVTQDTDGKRGFVLTLQAREQHIRREKANSNICSNQSLMALYVTIYMAVMGKQGIKEVQTMSSNATHYLYEKLIALDQFEAAYNQEFFKEFTVKTTIDPKVITDKLLKQGILGPLSLGKYDADKANYLLFSVTEKRTLEEVDQLISILEVL
ncbi:MAG: aminomethyl-transferring glycine dehydrogenase subunit GcvPA [Candidatus Izemoplasma sp.]